VKNNSKTKNIEKDEWIRVWAPVRETPFVPPTHAENACGIPF